MDPTSIADDPLILIGEHVATRYIVVLDGFLYLTNRVDRKIYEEMKLKEKDVRHKLMQHIVDSRKGIMNTNSTHYQYFEGKKYMAKRLTEPGTIFECDEEERRSSDDLSK